MELLYRSIVSILLVVYLRYGNDMVVGIWEINSGIMVFFLVELFYYFGFCIIYKLMFVKVVCKIYCIVVFIDKFWIDIDNYYLFYFGLVIIYR